MRGLLFVAVILIAVTAVAGTAVAASSDADHLGTEKLDKLHPARPIAASPTPTAYSVAGTAVRGSGVRTSSAGRSLQLFSDVIEVNDYIAAAAASAQAERARAELAAFIAANAAAEAAAPPPTPAPPEPVQAASAPSDPGSFLACIRWRESRGDYTVHNYQGSGAAGAYQFLPSTWNSIAAASGRPDLVGIDPASASVADQDAMAAALYAQQGSAPWGGACG